MSEKENVPPDKQGISETRPRAGSREDITALPVSRKLDSSPHLRPADLERPHIPYNFQPYSSSQISVQRESGVASPARPQTLRSRRSNYDSGTPQRRRSSKKRKDDHIREEEIRAMSAPIAIPKRPGEGPLRRDSKKMRSLGMRGSNVSLPPEESIHSTMSAITEQRGWEIGNFDMFNPRPAVRLSGVPQYVTSPGSVPSTSHASIMPLPKDKDKRPATKHSGKKVRETIGNRADDLDASDLRTLLERDAKRRERRKKEQQEKLDSKLRSRGGRNRGDSDKKRYEAEELRKAEDSKSRAEEERRDRELTALPTAVHPALRDTAGGEDQSPVGLGIEGKDVEAGASDAETRGLPENPFKDPNTELVGTPRSERILTSGALYSPAQIPREDPVLDTAQAVRMSQASTPPVSPVQSERAQSSLSQMLDSRRASDLPPPPAITDSRRSSEPRSDRRAGAWATFFRRGGTNLKKGDEGRSTPSEFSFSNTSRESMRNQPLPAHLVDTQAQLPRRTSGTPVRTQSKFREDLPEMPVSPPDSRMPSPDVTTAAAAAAAARRARRSPKPPLNVPEDSVQTDFETQEPGRNDTPLSPARGHGLMSASLASVDSEGSWLASGSAKRQSTQSALSRDFGSLSKRRPEFTASYEELGGDKDAEYFSKGSPSPDVRRALHGHKVSNSALAGASPDEETEYELGGRPVTSGGDPMTVHDSVRRKPTLVQNNPRMKSREGLLTEYRASGGSDTPPPQSAGTGKDSDFDFDPEAPEPQMQSARSVSVDFGKGHVRQVSAGSAKLLDMAARRPSEDIAREAGLTSEPQDSKL